MTICPEHTNINTITKCFELEIHSGAGTEGTFPGRFRQVQRAELVSRDKTSRHSSYSLKRFAKKYNVKIFLCFLEQIKENKKSTIITGNPSGNVKCRPRAEAAHESSVYLEGDPTKTGSGKMRRAPCEDATEEESS